MSASSSSFGKSGGGSNSLFIAAIVLVLVGGIAAVVAVASGRETNIGVAPEAGTPGDHWHSAYLINDCGVDIPATMEFESPDGIHTHGDGLLHIHPFNPTVSGRNATFGTYLEAYGATLTDESFQSGPADVVPVNLSEAEGCDGEPAELQLAVWRNAFDETAEPEIITENMADFVFDTAGMAITLALVPEGEQAPRIPQERLSQLSSTNAGGPIFGVEEGESPVVTLPVEDEEPVEGEEPVEDEEPAEESDDSSE